MPNTLTPEDIEELRRQGIDPSQVVAVDPTDEEMSKLGAAGSVLKAHAGGIAGGGAGALGGAELGTLGGPFAPITVPVGAVVGGLVGGLAGQKAQDVALPDDVTARLQQEASQAYSQHPFVAGATDIGASALASGGSFSPSTAVKAARGLVGRVGGYAPAAIDEVAEKAGQQVLSREGMLQLAKQEEEQAALRNVAIQSAVLPAINTGVNYAATGQLPTAKDLVSQAVGGALFAKPSWLGEKVGGFQSQPDLVDTTRRQMDENILETNNDRSPLDKVKTTTLSSPFTQVAEDGNHVIDDQAVKQAFSKLYPKPDIKGMSDTERYAAQTKWRNQTKVPVEEQRQQLSDVWFKIRESEIQAEQEAQKNMPPAPLKMARTAEDEAFLASEKLRVENEQRKEDFFKAQDELAESHPNEVAPKPPEDSVGKLSPNLQRYLPTMIDKGQLVPSEVSRPEVRPVGSQEDPLPNTTTVTPGRSDAEVTQDKLEGNGAKYSAPVPEKSQQYKDLIEKQKNLLTTGRAIDEKGRLTPAYMELWKEAERLKNENKGMPPTNAADKQNWEHAAGTPSAIVDHIWSGKATTGSVMKMFSEHPNHPFNSLAKWLYENMDSESRNVPWQDTLKERSSYYPPHMSDNPDTVQMAVLQSHHAPTVMEEALHSMTSAKLPREWEGLRGSELYNKMLSYTKKEGANKAVVDLVHSYVQTAEHLGLHEVLFSDKIQPETGDSIKAIAGSPDEAHAQGFLYAMGDLHEFIAHAFKDHDMQRLMNNMPSGLKDGRTMWQRVVDAVSKLLGVPVKYNSMLDRVLKSSADLVTQKRPTVEGKAGEAKPVSSKPVDKEVTSKNFGAFGKAFGSVLDNIRAIPHSGAKLLADSYQRALDKKQELVGRYTNKSIEAGQKLTTADKQQLSKAIEAFRVDKKEPVGLSVEAKKWFDVNRQLIDKFGKEHIANNIPIRAPNGTLRLMRQDPNHWPTMANQQTEELFRQGTKTEDMVAKQKEFEEYYQKRLGYTPNESKEEFQSWKKSITGNSENSGISNQDYFNAIRKTQGEPLPSSFREQDPVRNMARYFDRAGTAMAHYTEVEANPKAMATLGATKDPWLQPITPDADGSIANNKYVKAAVGQFRSQPKGVYEHTEESVSSLTTSLFISSPGLEVHKLGSNFVKSTLYAPNPYAATRAIGHAILNMHQGWEHAKEGGLVKLTANSVKDMLDTTLTTYQRMGSISKLVRDISTLGGMTTKANAAYQQAYFENLLPSIINRANAGNVEAIRMLKHWDTDYQKGKTYTQQETQRLASVAASYVHGTGDIRQMPAWMMNESEISGFMQLAHWSVAQTNNFMHDVWIPASRGNLTPLLTGMFGAAVGGYVIKDLREKIQGKQGQIPSLTEIDASDRGLAGNKGLLMYNAIAGMQYAGFGGLFSQVAKYPFDFIYKNKPQGATFPLDEIGSDILGTVGHVSTAIATDPNLNWVDLASAVSQHVLKSDIKLASIAINQGINNGLITGTPSYTKQLGDKLEQLRRFDQAEGLPYNEIDSGTNPFMNLEQKKFKREQDPQQAMQMLPGLINNIITTYHSNPDVMMSKLKALKENQYDTFPSLENMPLSFFKYISYLTREEGSQKAQDALTDYMKHKITNEVKSGMVP